MKVTPFPGALYARPLASGAVVIELPTGLAVAPWTVPPVPNGDRVRYPALSAGGQIAGQSQDAAGQMWRYQNGAWSLLPVNAYGTQPCAFIGEALYVSTPDGLWCEGAIVGPVEGVNGIRAVNGVIVSGDATYFDAVRELSEYTDFGDVAIGQYHKGTGCHAVFRDGSRRELLPGLTKWVTVHRLGDAFAIGIWQQNENRAVVIATTLADMRALPDWNESPPVEDPRKPPVDPPKEPPVSQGVDQTPTALDIAIKGELDAQRGRFAQPLPSEQGARNDELGRYLNSVVLALRSRGLPVWLESKAGNPDGDNCARLPGTSQGLANDIIQTVENGQRYGRDFLSSTGPGEPATPVFGDKGKAEDSKALLPVALGVPTPPPTGGGDPPKPTDPAVADALQKALTDLLGLEATENALVDKIAGRFIESNANLKTLIGEVRSLHQELAGARADLKAMLPQILAALAAGGDGGLLGGLLGGKK